MNVKQKSYQTQIARDAAAREGLETLCDLYPNLGRFLCGTGGDQESAGFEPAGTIMLSLHGERCCVTLVPHGSITCGFCDIVLGGESIDKSIDQAIEAGQFVWRARRYIRPDCVNHKSGLR